jgi:hypothetical protein
MYPLVKYRYDCIFMYSPSIYGWSNFIIKEGIPDVYKRDLACIQWCIIITSERVSIWLFVITKHTTGTNELVSDYWRIPRCSLVLKDVTLLRGVEGCRAAPPCWRMPRCSVVLEDATLLRGVEGCHAVPWCWRIPCCSVVLEDVTLLRGVEGCHTAPWCWRMPRCSVVLKDTTLLRIVEVCHAAPWCWRMPRLDHDLTFLLWFLTPPTYKYYGM